MRRKLWHAEFPLGLGAFAYGVMRSQEAYEDTPHSVSVKVVRKPRPLGPRFLADTWYRSSAISPLA